MKPRNIAFQSIEGAGTDDFVVTTPLDGADDADAAAGALVPLVEIEVAISGEGLPPFTVRDEGVDAGEVVVAAAWGATVGAVGRFV